MKLRINKRNRISVERRDREEVKNVIWIMIKALILWNIETSKLTFLYSLTKNIL